MYGRPRCFRMQRSHPSHIHTQRRSRRTSRCRTALRTSKRSRLCVRGRSPSPCRAVPSQSGESLPQRLESRPLAPPWSWRMLSTPQSSRRYGLQSCSSTSGEAPRRTATTASIGTGAMLAPSPTTIRAIGKRPPQVCICLPGKTRRPAGCSSLGLGRRDKCVADADADSG